MFKNFDIYCKSVYTCIMYMYIRPVMYIYRLMFWSDWGDRPKIMRSSLDGSFKTQLVTDVDVNVNYPNGLAIDYERQVLYWVDTNEDAVGMVHYNGR